MIYYSKKAPGLTAEVPFTEHDANGTLPAQVFGATWDNEPDGEPIPDPFYTFIKLEEWSPVPLDVWEGGFDSGFLVINEDDSLFDIVEDEAVAKSLLTKVPTVKGYVPIDITRTAMQVRRV